MLVGAALYLRQQSQTHKRLMLLATLALLTPAIARLPGIAAAGPPAFWGLTDLFIVACFVYDRVTSGRIHPAFKWGGSVRARDAAAAADRRRHRSLACVRAVADAMNGGNARD